MRQLGVLIGLLVAPLWLSAQNLQTFSLYGEDRGAEFRVEVEVRTAGSNSRPMLQFRVVENTAEFLSIDYNGKFYSKETLDLILFSYNESELPYRFNANIKLHLKSGVETGFCETSTEYSSPSFWVSWDGWSTVEIDDNYLKNCLREKSSNTWLDYGRTTYNGHIQYRGIEVRQIETSLNVPMLINAIRGYEEKNGGNDAAREVLDRYCNRNYESSGEIYKAIGEVNAALGRNITIAWVRDALLSCRKNLEQQLADLSKPKEDYSADGQYAKYVKLGREAEARQEFAKAIRYYQEALKFKDDYFLRQKIKQLEPQANSQALAAGGVEFVTGMTEAFSDLPTGRIQYGTYFFSISYNEYDYYRTDDLTGNPWGPSMYIAYDHNFWLDRSAYFGWHLGIQGFYGSPWDDVERNVGTDNEWTFSLDNNYRLGFYTGFNLYGYLELDYFVRGISMNGERFGDDANLDESYSVNFGGPLTWNGGLRGAVYLVRNKEFFIRGVGWWIDNTADSPVGFLDFSNETAPRIQSMGYRLELVSRPWSFSFYHSVDSYYPQDNNLLLGVDSWGFGLGFGAGTDY